MLHSDGEGLFEPYASLKDGRLLLTDSCHSFWPGFSLLNVRYREKLPFNQDEWQLSTPKRTLS
jgi:hypothetical protein